MTEDKVGWGGKRSFQPGRPRQSNYSGTTRVVRIPTEIDHRALITLMDDLQAIVGAYKTEADAAKAASVTGEYPRTYDVALRMLDELAHLLFTVNTLA